MSDDKTRENNTKAFNSMFRASSGDTGLKIAVDQNFSLGRVVPQEHFWYFTTTCPDCGQRNAISRDYDEGKAPKPLKGSGLLNVICTSCGNEYTSQASTVEAYKWPAAPL